MKNAIVYSIYVNESDASKNYNFEQLKLSVTTIRDINQDIPILVYMSPVGCLPKYASYPLTTANFIEFDLNWDKRLEHETYAKWTSHKWQSSFHALEKYQLDNILYVDTDTFFQKDPELLFAKYGNRNAIVGKKDISEDWTKVFDVKNGGMNDGQFLISKNMLKHKDELLKERVNYVLRLQEKFKESTDEYLKITGIQWVSCQYAISEYLHSIGKPLEFFDEEDVHIVHKFDEFKKLDKKILENFTLVHYLNYNTRFFCPPAYRIYLEARQ